MRYVKKPVAVEARQLTDDLRNHNEVANWINSNGGEALVPFADPCLIIVTLEGRMRADIGDYVIRGVKGEFYPCKPDIFADTYEPADETTGGPALDTRFRFGPDADGEMTLWRELPGQEHLPEPIAVRRRVHATAWELMRRGIAAMRKEGLIR